MTDHTDSFSSDGFVIHLTITGKDPLGLEQHGPNLAVSISGVSADDIDDTGHETLPKGHFAYGLGGCAVMATELDELRAKWRKVRQIVAGAEDAALRASSLKLNDLTPDQIATITSFSLPARWDVLRLR